MPTRNDELADHKLRYEREGWCEIPALFDQSDIALLRATVDRISRQERPEVVHEKDSTAVRAVHGCHEFDDMCARLVRLPRLVDLAEALLGAPAYVYQFKVNLKPAREGAAWPWHQDFAFWSAEDGMPAPRAVNIALLLDDVRQDNGPLVLIPGSHLAGLIDMPAGGQRTHGSWQDHVSTDLPYTVGPERADELTRRYGQHPVLGRAGTAYAFHPSIVHSSSSNLSADRRALLLVTYNAVDNAPPQPTRPRFLVGRDTSPIVRTSVDSLNTGLNG